MSTGQYTIRTPRPAYSDDDQDASSRGNDTSLGTQAEDSGLFSLPLKIESSIASHLGPGALRALCLVSRAGKASFQEELDQHVTYLDSEYSAWKRGPMTSSGDDHRRAESIRAKATAITCRSFCVQKEAFEDFPAGKDKLDWELRLTEAAESCHILIDDAAMNMFDNCDDLGVQALIKQYLTFPTCSYLSITSALRTFQDLEAVGPILHLMGSFKTVVFNEPAGSLMRSRSLPGKSQSESPAFPDRIVIITGHAQGSDTTEAFSNVHYVSGKYENISQVETLCEKLALLGLRLNDADTQVILVGSERWAPDRIGFETDDQDAITPDYIRDTLKDLMTGCLNGERGSRWTQSDFRRSRDQGGPRQPRELTLWTFEEAEKQNVLPYQNGLHFAAQARLERAAAEYDEKYLQSIEGGSSEWSDC